jgi:hypothetical protein
MKTKIFTTILLFIGLTTFAQTQPTKVFTGIIGSVTCGDSKCSIALSNTPDKSLELQYEADGKTLKLGDFGKQILQQVTVGGNVEVRIRPDFKTQIVKVTCTLKHVKGQDENGAYEYDTYLVERFDMVLEPDNFKTATCKAWSMTGALVYIVENNTLYSIKDGKKSPYKEDSKSIQNKDELCLDGNKCIKVKIDASGCVSVYNLPNVTEKIASLKVVGNKIYRTLDGGCELNEKKEHLIFSGNRTQISLIAVLYRLGNGH